MGFATVVMTGQLNRDPELRYSGTGTPVVTFGVTVRRVNGFGRSTTFVDCKQRGDGAENVAAKFKKGDEVRIEGSLQTERWKYCGQNYSKLIVDVAIMKQIERAE